MLILIMSFILLLIKILAVPTMSWLLVLSPLILIVSLWVLGLVAAFIAGIALKTIGEK